MASRREYIPPTDQPAQSQTTAALPPADPDADGRIPILWIEHTPNGVGFSASDEFYAAFPEFPNPPVPGTVGAVGFDLIAHLNRQIAFSETAFGPGDRTLGVCDHLRKEIVEVEDAHAAGEPTLPEWVDIVILGLDGAWRSGATAEEIVAAIAAKQAKNEGRTWPDWRTANPDAAIEHDRTADAPPAGEGGQTSAEAPAAD